MSCGPVPHDGQMLYTLLLIRPQYELRRLHHPDLKCAKTTRVCRASPRSSAVDMVSEYGIHPIFLHDFCYRFRENTIQSCLICLYLSLVPLYISLDRECLPFTSSWGLIDSSYKEAYCYGSNGVCDIIKYFPIAWKNHLLDRYFH